MGTVNGRWATILAVAVLLGWLGIHRFAVGKIGTGILWLLTSGLLGIGWIIDIILVLSGNFTDKSGTAIRRTGDAVPRRPAQAAKSSGPQTLEFIEKGTDPEQDSKGRVIVRLKAGSQIEIPISDFRDRDEQATDNFFQPRKKGEMWDEGEKTLRMRLVPQLEDYWGGQCYRLESPGGIPILEIRNYYEDDFTLTQKILTDVQARLRAVHPTLSAAQFVFDVPIRIDYIWEEEYDDEGNETGGVVLEWEDPRLRLKDPLEIEVRAT